MSKELEKSIEWLSDVNNFKNVSRYPKEYFEHFNKVVKALKQAKKQERLLNLYRKLITVKDEATSIVWFDAEMEAEVIDLEIQIKELENEERIILCREIEKLIKALDNLSCSSGKYHLVSQAISEIEKEKENE